MKLILSRQLKERSKDNGLPVRYDQKSINMQDTVSIYKTFI